MYFGELYGIVGVRDIRSSSGSHTNSAMKKLRAFFMFCYSTVCFCREQQNEDWSRIWGDVSRKKSLS